MKRILMVGPSAPPYGGISAVVETILKSSLSDEYQFDFFDKSDINSEHLNTFWERFRFQFKKWFNFYRTVNSGTYEFVHFQASVMAFPGIVFYLIMCRLAGAEILLHLHGTSWKRFYSQTPLWKKKWTRFGLSLSKKIIVLYSVWVNNIKQICPGTDVLVLRNLLEFTAPPDPDSVKMLSAQFDIPDNHFVIISVGTVGWRKGTFEILKAVPLVVQRQASVIFLLVGGEEFPGQLSELLEETQKGQVAQWVRFTDSVTPDQVMGLLSLSDLFILPSFSEGMPISIIEAMRAGMPIIASSVGGIPDMITDGESGILIHPGSPREIADAVLKAMQAPDLCRELGQGARKMFKEKFELSRGIQDLKAVYRDMERSVTSRPKENSDC